MHVLQMVFFGVSIVINFFILKVGFFMFMSVLVTSFLLSNNWPFMIQINRLNNVSIK
jgi:hypothetical protein